MAAPGGAQTSALAALRGHDPALRTTIDQALRAAQADCNVLIVGETGTGKDLLARVVHEGSRRAASAFVPVNCGGIPRELIGSELFGHEKGAFTGALADRDGYFVEAHGGTLFLDEIGELPIEMQPHLLRALESRRVRRVGGASERPVDVRIVAATNRSEGLGTESSRLRTDLYHRLATVVLSLPPLRERMGDLVELVEHLLAELVPEHGDKVVTAASWKVLAAYPWPGNVRELRHAVARAVALGGVELGPEDFFPELRFGRNPQLALVAEVSADRLVPYQAMLRGAMEQALRVHGSIRAAASHLGMAKSTFADKAKQWGLIPRPRLKLPADRPITAPAERLSVSDGIPRAKEPPPAAAAPGQDADRPIAAAPGRALPRRPGPDEAPPHRSAPAPIGPAEDPTEVPAEEPTEEPTEELSDASGMLPMLRRSAGR